MLTACGIETFGLAHATFVVVVATAPTACGIETDVTLDRCDTLHTVATAPTACGMRRRVPAEEQSDDEVRTSLVPDRREGKTME